MNEIKANKKTLVSVGVIVLILLAISLIVGIFKGLKEYKYIGSGPQSGNVIIVNGEGKIERSPDTARVTFSVNSESRVLADAQKVVDDKFTKIQSELVALGLDSNDISTERYSSYPRYTYVDNRAPVLRGYEVSHNVVVKVKDLELVGGVIDILGKNTVTDISGPNFGFDDDKAISREARELAIEDAKDQAEKLAQDLGVKLVRIVSFTEEGGYARSPIVTMAKQEVMQFASNMDSSASLAVGEREVRSNVTIVYEIR